MNQRANLCTHCQGELEAEFAENKFMNPSLQKMGLMRNNSGWSSRYVFINPTTEMELAMELMAVSSEAEMDQFLGNVFKKVWGGIKKVGSFVGKIAKPLGGVLKTLAKKALPFVGGALGSLIPIPGVGTMVGKALGSAVSNALELEFANLQQEEAEFEMARRFVRIAHTAASQLGQMTPTPNVLAAVENAVVSAARTHLPRLDTRAITRGAASLGSGGFGFTNSRAVKGEWTRQGRTIVLEL